jgi:hypothetical protein
MVAANPQKLLGRNKKIQSEVDSQQQQLTAAPINIAVSQNILKSLAKITELISQQNSQIVEIIKEVKKPKSAGVQPQQNSQIVEIIKDVKQLKSVVAKLVAKPQQNSQIVEIIKDVKQLKSVVAKPQQQLIGPPAVDAKPQQNSQIVEIIKDVKQLKSVVAKPQQQLIGPPAVDAKPQQNSQIVEIIKDVKQLKSVVAKLVAKPQQNSQIVEIIKDVKQLKSVVAKPQQQLIGPPAVDAKPQQNSQIVEIIKDVKQLKSVVAKPQQQLIGPPAVDAKPQQNSQIVEIIKDVKQLKSVVAKLVAKPQQQLIGPPAVDAKPQQQLIAAPADTAALQDISKSLARITQLLTQQNSQVTAEANQERKNQENAKRKKVELGLENSFAAVKNVAQAVVAPVKNILDSIIQFFVTLFLGKAILNLIDWFSKKENQSKIRSIARFLKDWWPALVAGYILFGTGFGRVVRNLAGIGLSAIKGLGGITLKLIGAIA